MWKYHVNKCERIIWINVTESYESMWKYYMNQCERIVWINVKESYESIWQYHVNKFESLISHLSILDASCTHLSNGYTSCHTILMCMYAVTRPSYHVTHVNASCHMSTQHMAHLCVMCLTSLSWLLHVTSYECACIMWHVPHTVALNWMHNVTCLT